jgi:crotonobetaine/carnitine-CoA ligase
MLSTLVGRSKARVLIIANEFSDRLPQVVKDCELLETVIIPDAEAPPDLAIRVLVEGDIEHANSQTFPGPAHHDPLGIVYTSGTTGPSKGVVVPWAQMSDAVNANFAGDNAADYENGAYYCPWPPYNLLGKGAFDIAVRQGLRLVLRRRFSQSNFWSDVRTYGCTHAAIPFIGPWLWCQPEKADDATNPLRRVLMVPVMSEHVEFGKRFGVRVSTGYATTECGFAIGTADPVDPASCGRALEGFEVRVVDEHDETVAPGELGELVARHRRPWHQMTGYFDDPAATAAAWRNGWYHTGDAFRYDEAGNLYFSGRLKDYIKHRGQNVSASDLESQVNDHVDVIECACVGIPTELAGEGGFADEDIKLFVIKSDASTLTESELYEFLRERIPRFMYPQCIEFIASLPRGQMNKVLKRELRTRPRSGVFFPPRESGRPHATREADTALQAQPSTTQDSHQESRVV